MTNLDSTPADDPWAELEVPWAKPVSKASGPGKTSRSAAESAALWAGLVAASAAAAEQ